MPGLLFHFSFAKVLEATKIRKLSRSWRSRDLFLRVQPGWMQCLTPSLAVGNMQIVPPSVTNRSTRVDLASFGICPTRGSKDSAGLIHSECDAEVIYPQDRSPLPWWQACCTIETSCLPEDSQRHCLEPRASSPPTSALLPHVGSPHTALHWVSQTWVWRQCCQQLEVQIHFRNEESSDSLNLPRKSPHLGRWPDDKVRSHEFQTHGHAALSRRVTTLPTDDATAAKFWSKNLTFVAA